MNNIKQAFLSGLVFLGTVITGFIAFATYTSLPTQGDGATITQTIWNDVINKINTIGNNVDTLTGSRLGAGQTRQDVTSSRVAGTTYTNNTGKPIFVSIYGNQTSQGTQWLYINGIMMSIQTTVTTGTNNVYGIIPNGSTYYWGGNNSATITKWLELR